MLSTKIVNLSGNSKKTTNIGETFHLNVQPAQLASKTLQVSIIRWVHTSDQKQLNFSVWRNL
jgi:hypothetical protein